MSDEIVLSDDEIEAILESGDPDQIEAMLSGNAPAKAETDEAAEEVVATEEAENKQVEESATTGAEAEEVGAYVEGKSGKSKIPYTVLEDTRKERNELRKELDDARAKLAGFESQSSKISAVLEKNGIDLTALEHGETLTEEQIASLEELDPAIAQMARLSMRTFERLQEISGRIDKVQVNESPVEAAINSIDDLSNWRKSDPDRWDTAIKHDNLLKQHPEFKNASLQERFAEAARLTKLEFGDEIAPTKQRGKAEDIAAQKIAAASKSSAPRSLTDLGASPATERTQAEVLADLSYDAIADKMADMTPEQIDKLLAQAL